MRRWIYDHEFLTAFTAIAVGVTVVCFLIFVVIRNITVHYDRAACHSFSEQANRETKFVNYTYWAWDCLTPTADGKWISAENLREFGEQP